MTDENLKGERKAIYAATRNDLLARNLSNSEKYDNAILTLSTGILAISLAFIKDIVPINESRYIVLLLLSWIFFGVSIITTLVSFVLSQFAIKKQLDHAGKYYLEEKDEYLMKENKLATLTEYSNYASGIFFVVGIVITIIFVAINLNGGNKMTTKPKENGQIITEGATIPVFQAAPVTLKKGANIPNMQPVGPGDKTTQQSVPQGGQPSSGNSGSSNSGDSKK